MAAMDVEIVGKYLSTLPEDDDHPYRTGPWRPQTTEWDADDLTWSRARSRTTSTACTCATPRTRCTRRSKFYHPFDGDGMVHVVGFRDGKAFYRNRFIRTDGFAAENEAGGPLWPGLAEPVQLAKRDKGWGARGLMKDASSTDVIVHRGTALTSFYQCGDLYRVDPYSGDTLGKADWGGAFPFDWGVSAHPKVDDRTGELLFFNYSKQAPYMHYGVVDENNELVHYVDVPLPGPRLPHDMAFTANYVILNDFPLFWDPEAAAGRRSPAAVPPRHAVAVRRDPPPRRNRRHPMVRGRPDVRAALHQRLRGRRRDRARRVLRGRTRARSTRSRVTSSRGRSGSWRWTGCRPGCTAGGSTSSPARCTEEQLSDSITEFGMINAGYAGGNYRYTYAATGKPGWFLFDGLVKHDLQTGDEQRFAFDDGVYGSETAMAPRIGSTAEDDGYLVTLTTDMNADASYCLVFDAARVADGPVCKLALPERISSGTHSTWAPGSELRRWHEADSAAAAIGL